MYVYMYVCIQVHKSASIPSSQSLKATSIVHFCSHKLIYNNIVYGLCASVNVCVC